MANGGFNLNSDQLNWLFTQMMRGGDSGSVNPPPSAEPKSAAQGQSDSGGGYDPGFDPRIPQFELPPLEITPPGPSPGITDPVLQNFANDPRSGVGPPFQFGNPIYPDPSTMPGGSFTPFIDPYSGEVAPPSSIYPYAPEQPPPTLYDGVPSPDIQAIPNMGSYGQEPFLPYPNYQSPNFQEMALPTPDIPTPGPTESTTAPDVSGLTDVSGVTDTTPYAGMVNQIPDVPGPAVPVDFSLTGTSPYAQDQYPFGFGAPPGVAPPAGGVDQASFDQWFEQQAATTDTGGGTSPQDPSLEGVNPQGDLARILSPGQMTPLYPTQQDVFQGPTPQTFLDRLRQPTNYQAVGNFFRDAAGNIVDATGRIVSSAGNLLHNIGDTVGNFFSGLGYTPASVDYTTVNTSPLAEGVQASIPGESIPRGLYYGLGSPLNPPGSSVGPGNLGGGGPVQAQYFTRGKVPWGYWEDPRIAAMERTTSSSGGGTSPAEAQRIFSAALSSETNLRGNTGIWHPYTPQERQNIISAMARNAARNAAFASGEGLRNQGPQGHVVRAAASQ